MVAAEYRGRHCDERRRALRLEPTAIFVALAPAGGESHSAVREERNFADRLVAAGAGRSDGKIRSQFAAARRNARHVRVHERCNLALDGEARAPSRATAKAAG